MDQNTDPNLVGRLVEALRQQQAELGDIAIELISLLSAAGLGGPERETARSSGSSPVDGVGATRRGAR